MNGLQEIANTFSLQFFIPFIVLYISAVIYTNRRYKKWPIHRTICWCLSMLFIAVAVTGPLAELAHTNFTMHMVGHLLLGMLAPLLLVLSAPMTLLLRTLSTKYARTVTKLLKSWPSSIVTHPIFTTMLNIGGLWLLYTSNLYIVMHDHIVMYVIVHVHIFGAGYLLTLSMIYIDPIFHRKSFLYRAIVLVLAIAGHSILAKYLYAHPPIGVEAEQAQQGSIVMYYGGDIIDAVLIFILCLQWYRATKPRVVREVTSGSH